jgi:uncharacterized protein (TIGR03083 family)
MEHTLELGRHLEGIRHAVDAFATQAAAAGLGASVPTTPDWDVRRLLAHQGLVHRWATATVHGEDIDEDTVEREGLEAADPVSWLRAGADRLIATIEAAPADLETFVFLVDAPPAKRFWARRQCHETTIHAVDALSAALGRYPRADDTWISRDIALDGIDELLTGFMPRPRSRLRSDDPTTIAVVPEDADAGWTVTVTQRPPTTVREASPDDADIVVRGSAVALYLTLWNRSDELDGTELDLWAEGARVTWA